MAEKNYIGSNSILYILQKVKNKFSQVETTVSSKVEKVEGKGLSTNDFTNEMKTKLENAGTSSFSGDYNDLSNKPTIPTDNTQLLNGAGYQTAAQVLTAVANANHLKREKVSALPEIASADVNTIYMLTKSGKDNDNFDEYMVMDGAWEIIGNSNVDLSNYVQNSDIIEITNAEIDTLWNSVFNTANR